MSQMDSRLQRKSRQSRTERLLIPESELERAWVAAALSLPKIPEHLRGQVAALLTWQTFAVIGGTIAAIVAAHIVNPLLGLAVDVIVAGISIGLVGMEAVQIAREFGSFWQTARHAETKEQLDRAAQHFADAVTRVGVTALAVLVARRSAPKAAGMGSQARWDRLISVLRLEVPPHRGALWSRLGPQGAERAKKFAAGRGRVTLEATDDFVAFKGPYDAEFGTLQNKVTAGLWEKLSRRFAQGLEGTIEVYTDLPQLNSSIQRAAMKAGKSTPEDLRLLPQLTAELDEISTLMLENQKITAVTIFDVNSGVQLHMTRAEVLRAAANTH